MRHTYIWYDVSTRLYFVSYHKSKKTELTEGFIVLSDCWVSHTPFSSAPSLSFYDSLLCLEIFSIYIMGFIVFAFSTLVREASYSMSMSILFKLYVYLKLICWFYWFYVNITQIVYLKLICVDLFLFYPESNIIKQNQLLHTLYNFLQEVHRTMPILYAYYTLLEPFECLIEIYIFVYITLIILV